MAGTSRKRTPRSPRKPRSGSQGCLPSRRPFRVMETTSRVRRPLQQIATNGGLELNRNVYALSDLQARSPSEVSVLRATPFPGPRQGSFPPRPAVDGPLRRWLPAASLPPLTPRWSHCRLRPSACSHLLPIQDGLALSSFKDALPSKATASFWRLLFNTLHLLILRLSFHHCKFTSLINSQNLRPQIRPLRKSSMSNVAPPRMALRGGYLTQKVAGEAGEDTEGAAEVPTHPASRGLSIIGRMVLFGM